MEPNIPVGSVICVQKITDSTALEVGEIISYDLKDEVVTHRIVSLNQGKIQTKGDANSSNDPMKISRNDVIGKYVWHIPYVGYALNYVKRNYLWVISMMICIWIFRKKFMEEKVK